MENRLAIKKNLLRVAFHKLRNSLSLFRKQEASEKALQILSLQHKNILSFASFGSEIDLWLLNQKLALEKRLFLPRTNGENLDIYEIFDISSQLLESTLFPHLLEPNPTKCRIVKPNVLSCILVPALAFDKNFFRLGYGKGYYDRLLSKNTITTIGIGYKEQLIEKLPISETDIPVETMLLF